MDNDKVYGIRNLCYRLRNAREFFENPLISDEEKQLQEQNLEDLINRIEREANFLTGEEKDFAIELLSIIYSGGDI